MEKAAAAGKDLGLNAVNLSSLKQTQIVSFTNLWTPEKYFKKYELKKETLFIINFFHAGGHSNPAYSI